MTSSPSDLYNLLTFEPYEQDDLFEQLLAADCNLDDAAAATASVPTPPAPRVALDEGPSQQEQLQPDTLPLLQPADWDEQRSYDEHPPTCIHYSIEWKVKLNKRVVSEDTCP
jgi:hypothetical protein